MKTIETYIDIQASATDIWKILVDFSAYPTWNPFITSIEGTPAKGEKLTITLQLPNKGKQLFRPVCLDATPNKELRWKGKLLFKGVFDGEHIFELQTLNKNTVRVFQREYFSGILVPLLWKKIEAPTLEGFKQMNSQLKKQAEQSQKGGNQSAKAG
ncbi:MAG: SRPBCC domain-containing protein [Bacteroidales bacterium]|jgi:hypothetical protein